jgi:hypothetical protein
MSSRTTLRRRRRSIETFEDPRAHRRGVTLALISGVGVDAERKGWVCMAKSISGVSGIDAGCEELGRGEVPQGVEVDVPEPQFVSDSAEFGAHRVDVDGERSIRAVREEKGLLADSHIEVGGMRSAEFHPSFEDDPHLWIEHDPTLTP